MIVILDISPEGRALIERHGAFAGRAREVMQGGLLAAGSAMANEVGTLLYQGALPLKSRTGGLGGLAGQIGARSPCLGVVMVGVPDNAPAAVHAAKQEEGGKIIPRSGKRLAVPLNRKAERYESPRDVPGGLTLIPRKGRAPLLAKVIGGSKVQHKGQRIEPWYVLLRSVTLRRGKGWFTQGIAMSVPLGVQAFQQRLDNEMQKTA